LTEKPALKLDFVLNNKGVILVVNGFGKLGGDGMMSSLVFDNQSLVALHTLENRRLLNRPCTNVCPLLVVGLDVLLRVGGAPSGFPVVGKLLEERCLEFCGLQDVSAGS
jgi:hypothetical protein